MGAVHIQNGGAVGNVAGRGGPAPGLDLTYQLLELAELLIGKGAVRPVRSRNAIPIR